MPYNSFNNARMYEIGCIIADPSRSYYKPFPEFTPLEFEHFCAYLLYLQGYEITRLNSKIEPDGGIDFVAKKLDQWVIVQVKKSDWTYKTKQNARSGDYNIGLASVDRLLGTLEKKKDLYPNAIGYFFTLRRFSNIVTKDYCTSDKIYLYNLDTIRGIMNEIDFHRFGVQEVKGLAVVANNEIEYWGKAQYETVRSELEIVEKLITDKTFEINSIKAKINEVESIIFESLRDLYKQRDLLKSQLEYVKLINTEKSKIIQEEIKKAFDGFQDQINKEYEEVQKEFEEKKVIELSEEELTELKLIWRELSRTYHPDKHLGKQDYAKYEQICKLINNCNDKQDLKKLQDIKANPLKYFGIDSEDTHKFNSEFEAKIENLRAFLKLQRNELFNLENQLDSLLADSNYLLYKKDKNELGIIIENLKLKLKEEIKTIQDNIINLKQTTL